MARETWGIIDRLPSGRYRARYTHDGARHKAPDTFETKTQAREYLAGERSAIAAGTWIHPDEREKAPTAPAARCRRVGCGGSCGAGYSTRKDTYHQPASRKTV